jgi:hypothetical protein
MMNENKELKRSAKRHFNAMIVVTGILTVLCPPFIIFHVLAWMGRLGT